MMIWGKEYPDTPSGYREAAGYIAYFGPEFRDDVRMCLRKAARIEMLAALNRCAKPVAAIAMIGLIAWYGHNKAAAELKWAWDGAPQAGIAMSDDGRF